MKIIVNSISYNVEIKSFSDNIKRTPIIFLHGFTGSSEDWTFLDKLHKNFLPITIDLIGHGQTDSPKELKHYSIESIIAALKVIMKKLNIDKAVIYGYSMGGRAALAFASKYPALVKALILESSTAGLSDPVERGKRIFSDNLLADRIDKIGVRTFIDDWIKIPLFESLQLLDPEKIKVLKKQKYKNCSTGLSNSLRGFGTGIMPSYKGNLQNISCQTLLLSGELDSKFTAINLEMNTVIKKSTHEIISSAGHNIHFEKPDILLQSINKFLESISASR
ncbi:MAG: 2-succinyl-6-hydroxy-2,4-cyclohexadiene-1-carboxylate synthase [Melioribacteraceae bacterium]|nr:2-succinyl-6-hydroxy-2,4-cyclohexadiene-1-carboxylate synthase [Melioribacteraceae bacterium]